MGYEAIQKAYTSKDVYGYQEVWVITSSGYTEQARDVKLWDRDVLIEQMANVNAAQTISVKEPEQADENATAPLPTTRTQDDDLFVCARCGKPVTNKIKDFCLSNPRRFSGRIYCYDHQRLKN
ncbi:hypothetical protein BBD42_21565 [Paenibacillus sp. BIHB 4019]|uniref:Uncharacterized protein n=1 Tax=Paenibacillus sp. BIHB 4019 TaxID=1870819 RepID=A0A1B2DM37_9BACL|nr:hypothetical protein BBD42_21565 [Paenibacillus sp. BIHB 4019]